MANERKFLRRVTFGIVMLLGAFAAVLQADVPRGWFLAGSKPDEFTCGVDSGETYQGHASAFLKSKPLNIDGFGTLMQRFAAEQYRGKRLRLSGLVKLQDVSGWAGLWMRVDRGKDAVAFDNMQDRSIKSTTDWRRYDVVLDVPEDATGISFGVLLDGAGEVWLTSTNFDVVGNNISVTGVSGSKIPNAPVNLDFRE